MPSITTSNNHSSSRDRAELVNLACDLLATWYPAVPQSLIRCQVETLQTDHLCDFADAATDSATAELAANEPEREREGFVDDDNDKPDTDGEDDSSSSSSVNTRDMADLSLLDPETQRELLRDVELDASQVLSTGSSENNEGYVVLPPPIDDFPVLIFQDDAERCQRSHEEICQVLHFLKIEQFVRTRPHCAKLGAGGANADEA